MGCSTESILNEADKLFAEKKYSQALAYYEKYIQTSNNQKNLAHALYKAGFINQVIFENCKSGSFFFETIVKKFPESDLSKEALFRTIFCPNYFYPTYNLYILGDSQSFGKNAKEIIRITKKNFFKIDFISEIYAGKKLISKDLKSYIVEENSIYEKSKAEKKLILKYPLDKNQNIKIDDRIIEIKTGIDVKVKAGFFSNCISIKTYQTNSKTGIVYYMAPEIGKILISSFYEDKETRIMELISYE